MGLFGGTISAGASVRTNLFGGARGTEVFNRPEYRTQVFGLNVKHWQKHPVRVTFQMTEYFVDRPRVMKAMLRARKQPLMKAGAFIRRTARQSMKKRKRPSAPGTPPRAHTNGVNLRTIFFAWDILRENVVVGPVLFRGADDGGGKTPKLHEFGGHKRKVVRDRYGPKRFGRRRARARYIIRYPKRPYMNPALKKNAPKFPGLWENSVVRTVPT